MIKRDWRFSEDGDIELGSHKVNGEGNLIYVNRFGDISTDPAEGMPVRDIALHSQTNVIKQVLRNRLKTDSPDWFHHPEMGGNLSDLVGEPNTRATGQKGVELITNALSYDGYINTDNINVRPVPVSSSVILFLIELKNIEGFDMDYPVLFDLEQGVLTEYEVPKEEEIVNA
jgi:phage baseplate assembly protein W